MTVRSYGTVAPEARNEMSGLEFVQGLANRTLPLNTIARTLGYDVTPPARRARRIWKTGLRSRLPALQR